jgi:hypothetical protein
LPEGRAEEGGSEFGIVQTESALHIRDTRCPRGEIQTENEKKDIQAAAVPSIFRRTRHHVYLGIGRHRHIRGVCPIRIGAVAFPDNNAGNCLPRNGSIRRAASLGGWSRLWIKALRSLPQGVDTRLSAAYQGCSAAQCFGSPQGRREKGKASLRGV